jgi:hypothetical protein
MAQLFGGLYTDADNQLELMIVIQKTGDHRSGHYFGIFNYNSRLWYMNDNQVNSHVKVMSST